MERLLLGFVIGLTSSLIWPTLPAMWVGVVIAFFAIFTIKTNQYFASFLIGTAYFIVSINQHFSDLTFVSSANSSIKGTIISLPKQGKFNNSFYFQLEQLETSNLIRPMTSKLLIYWQGVHDLKQGQRLMLQVVVKPLHGLANQGSFNYQQWLIAQGVIAVANVKRGEIIDSSPNLRAQVSQRLNQQTSGLDYQQYIRALAIGDKQGFTVDDWAVLSATGTSHLFAISGLHLSLVFFFVYSVFTKSLCFLSLRILHRTTNHTRWITVGLSFFVVIGYAYLAGMSTPTVRALLMLALTLFFLLINQKLTLQTVFLFTISCLLIIDPLAILSTSFWLSVTAVAVIIFFTLMSSPQKERAEKTPLRYKIVVATVTLLKIQLALWLGMALLQILIFKGVSLAAPLANMVALPLISLLVLPIIIVALLLGQVSYLHGVSHMLFIAADRLFSVLMPFLQWIIQCPYQWLELAQPWHVLMVVLIVLLIGAYKFVMVKKHAYLVFIRSCISVILVCLVFMVKGPINNPQPILHFLDVGHGNAAVLQVGNEAIIIDTAANKQHPVAEKVIFPFLRHWGISSISYIIISHADNDHSGGLPILKAHFPSAQILYNKLPAEPAGLIKPLLCDELKHIVWRGVELRFARAYFAQSNKTNLSENNQSCLVHLRYKNHTALFTGDIERAAENRLIRQLDSSWQARILQVPHHGSATSSSQSFLKLINPEYGVVSAARFNQWFLPHHRVLSRYRKQGSTILNTAKLGQISFDLSEKTLRYQSYRQDFAPFWYNRDLSFGHFDR
ncbi:DNA internalization-related competence protein ComEC/Rec2 [Psychrobium sp. 1_MG-2023]|uniref:DNA internalization-related competence protein ComEC/Rec2 n=1 Tax=Psychrobium sp. 1_MG-2023 TaxID=3062624 RepID=UPI000C31C0BF|nr:DNA internalization-related competence protein ComEC/Rec2 [Psychrobium sp. 1_MG-2023]MDP2560283.1 DNA internalization-related competence protein ComEC/Rec2 [Psychrobium sp. 1_MG-2023]PKF55400.1 DNA internalization-related competence protein ComEC/Rec2 [Alteromonadales bacterium alter-6D02]